MGEDVRLSGTFSLDGEVGLKDFEPLADVDFNLSRGRILAQGAFFDFDSFKGGIGMSRGDLLFDLSCVFGRSSGSLDGSIKIHDPSGARALSGDVRLKDFRLQRTWKRL